MTALVFYCGSGNFKQVKKNAIFLLLYVQEVVTQPKILNRTILSNLIHVTENYFAL